MHLKIGTLAGMFTITRPSIPVKPPPLTKYDAIRLWFANKELNQTSKAVVRRKDQYKASAATAGRRCTELETRLSELSLDSFVAHFVLSIKSQGFPTNSIQGTGYVAPLLGLLTRRVRARADHVEGLGVALESARALVCSNL